MPLVTVIIPSYNHERYLSDAIESVLAQTLTDFELIIIDDASSDNSKSIIQKYQIKDTRIKSFFHQTNLGIAKTVNEGINAAEGKYIAFFSSDDVYLPIKLEKELEILKMDENLIVWSDAEIIDANSNFTGHLWSERYNLKDKLLNGYLFNSLIPGNYICGQSKLLRRDNLKDLKLNPRLKYLNDSQFEIETARTYNYYFIDQPLVKYRLHGENSILKGPDNWAKDNIKLSIYLLSKYHNDISFKNKIILIEKSVKWYLLLIAYYLLKTCSIDVEKLTQKFFYKKT